MSSRRQLIGASLGFCQPCASRTLRALAIRAALRAAPRLRACPGHAWRRLLRAEMSSRELINLHVGHSGARIGDAAWALALLEHGARPRAEGPARNHGGGRRRHRSFGISRFVHMRACTTRTQR